ncbi:MAG: GTPase HflX [Candidatus Omnitrophota bacterium]
MERVLLVAIKTELDKDAWALEDIAQETKELVATCGAEVVDDISCLRDKPTPNLYIGKGKAEELSLICQEENIDTVIFSQDLSGTQQRNLEEVIARKVIDRTQLILHIFARHALTPEGKMQVELAQLGYSLPRLAGRGIPLSRLGGGIGTKGPGEQKLETDRRRIRARIAKLKDDLKQVSLHRQTMRKRRQENYLPTVALVGYTNAGKSSLLNALTQAGQVVANNLFTTLDPLSKNLKLPNGENIILSDTVGFLHNLPHHLVEAFKATLEEVVEADLLIHVIDVANPLFLSQAKAVTEVLKQLNAQDKPMVTALNKIDLLGGQSWLAQTGADFPNPVAISAKLKQNLDKLLEEISLKFKPRMITVELLLPHKRMDLVDLFHRQGKVVEIKYLQKGIKVKVNLPRTIASKILQDKEIAQLC